MQSCQDKLAAIRRDQDAIRRKQYAASSCPICLEEFTGAAPAAPEASSSTTAEVPEGKGEAMAAAAAAAAPAGVSGMEGEGQGRRAAAAAAAAGDVVHDVEEVWGMSRLQLAMYDKSLHDRWA